MAGIGQAVLVACHFSQMALFAGGRQACAVALGGCVGAAHLEVRRGRRLRLEGEGGQQ